MKIFTFLFIVSIALNSCYSKSSSITTIKNKIDFSDIFYGIKNKKTRDSYYFDTWTHIIDKKIGYSAPISLHTALDIIKSDYNKTVIIAKVKNLKFKIIPYKKNDDEKAIEYIASVIKCYKGICPDKIHYRISYEIGDTIYLKNGSPAIVLLSKYDNIFYLNDQFAYFPANKKLEIGLNKLILNLK